MRYTPWILRVVWQPDVELDLLDEQGRPNHAKIMGYYIFSVFVVLSLMDKLPSVGHTIAIISAGFGWVMFRTFLASKTVTSQEEIMRHDGAYAPPEVREFEMPDED